MRRYNAVSSVGAEHIKITVLKAVLVEHIECFRLILLHGDNLVLKQSLGFFGSAILACPRVGRDSTARLELAAGLSEPGLRPELGEPGERALEVFHGLGGSRDFAEPTAVGKKRSGVLEGADHVASIGQRVAKELVDHIRTRKQSAAACQGRERRRPFRLAALLFEDQHLVLRLGGSPRADESLDQIARAMGKHGGVAPALLELRLAYLE